MCSCVEDAPQKLDCWPSPEQMNTEDGVVLEACSPYFCVCRNRDRKARATQRQRGGVLDCIISLTNKRRMTLLYM